MATQDTATEVAAYREGSRWINERPPSNEVADWFLENAPIHEGLNPERYVTGVTLIPNEEKYKVVQGSQIVERKRLVFTPYIKVETRVLYFHDLAELRDWLPVLEPDPSVRNVRGEHLTNEHLPDGFFRMPLLDNAGKLVHYLGGSWRAALFAPDVRSGGRGRPVKDFVTGTKQVPTTSRWGADDNAMMKAQTGAVGRALGFLGMLVLPGSGVATAEDMQEALTQGAAPRAGDQAELPVDQPMVDLQEQANELIAQLQSEHPAKYEELEQWARDRKINLEELKDAQLRGVVRQAERKLADAGG